MAVKTMMLYMRRVLMRLKQSLFLFAAAFADRSFNMSHGYLFSYFSEYKSEFDTNSRPGARDYQVNAPDSSFLLVGSLTDCLNLGGKYDTKFLVVIF